MRTPFLPLAILPAVLALSCNQPRRSHDDDTGAAPADPFALSQTTTSPDGLMTIKHPSGYTPKTTTSPEGSSVVLNPTGDNHGSATLVSKPHITSDLEGFVKDFNSPHPTETKQVRSSGTCAGKPGVVIKSSWTVQGQPFVRWRCYAVANGHGAIATYQVIESHAARYEPVLRSMVDSVAWKK